ncbi:Putative tyrosine-protein kinase F09A5.2 [Caenorhabditis elegans]|uniref:Putative tyrosine-protein kinase F09A5.2 n=1 Tax=Caenorhabditis elegans TaxID=6239 RepID=YS3J_CAEEL|nr:Putative tyrosine-protein kinase F09A5.2 [Caenorhabditis elegans]Q19238.3 RecName: Full=Putative tyrosine-protein kinase F09A5.2 [Caenorhabditis elegans]VTW47554.1 Putative tyrosine-protein kinase F09A5.2 [Caenorhabditis elegans]
MHHPKETLLIDSSNPSYSHLTEYRFDNLKREESRSTSLFGDRRRVMKILSGFSLIIIVVFIFATSHEQALSTTGDLTSSTQSTTHGGVVFTYPTTRKSPGKGCVLNSQRSTPKNLKQYTGNISDACLAGIKSSNCKTWLMTNAVILKYSDDVVSNCPSILEFVNKTSLSCSGKSQIQYMYPQSDSASSDCNHSYDFNSNALNRAIYNFNYSKTLISTSYANTPGFAMYTFLLKIMNCVNKNGIKLDAGILNIFTDMTYIDLCESDVFMSSFPDTLNKLIEAGYIVKFYFLNQNLQDTQKNVENVLAGCKYMNSRSYCEIVDWSYHSENPNEFEICIPDSQPSGKKEDFNWHVTELLLIIGIPCISLTICCIAFFVCCLKCAKLKMAMMRMNVFSNDTHQNPDEMELKKRWIGMRKKFNKDVENGSCKELNTQKWSHFASANNYMDIQALANANKKDIWEIDTKNLLVQEDHLLGNGAFANVYKGIVKGKIPLLVVNNSLNMTVESENNGHYEAAIKKLPAHADEQNHLDFFHEIDFMKRLGHHPHVISMLGCVSNPYEPLIVVEYCARGDLLKFLRRHKDYVLMNKTDDCPIEADMCLRIKDLVSIAWQVADGMSYLASKNFIHRDLAARNILLTKSLTAKVSDFGLCRYMDSALYTAKGGRLPIKWMSVEALKLYEFSTKTDVWSFGVLLFEIFSMGDVPYPTIQQVDMLEHLLAGGRLSQPLKCPNEIFNIMQKCWAEKPEDRPEFNEMRGEITVMLNLDDESYGYLSVESQGGPKYTQLTMQDSKETAPCSTPGGSQDMDEDGDYDSGSEGHSQGTCAQLDQVLTERFGEEQKKEIKQIFCEITSKSMRGKRRQSNSTVSTYQS